MKRATHTHATASVHACRTAEAAVAARTVAGVAAVESKYCRRNRKRAEESSRRRGRSRSIRRRSQQLQQIGADVFCQYTAGCSQNTKKTIARLEYESRTDSKQTYRNGACVSTSIQTHTHTHTHTYTYIYIYIHIYIYIYM